MSHTLAQLRQAVKDQAMGGRSLFETDDYIDAAINRAIESAYPHWYTEKTATFAGTASTYEYTVATDAGAVTRVEAYTNGSYYPLTQWNVAPPIAGGTTKAIRFNDSDHAGDTISYHYIASPATLSNSTSTTGVHIEYIVNSASYLILLALAMQESDEEARSIFLAERDKCEARANRARIVYAQRRPSVTVTSQHRPH